MDNSEKIILSLFDNSGNWSKPYRDAGYTVIQHDIQNGWDIFEDTIPAAILDHHDGVKVHGILAAVPCTDFANSGARWWERKANEPAPYDGFIHFENRLDYFESMVMSVLYLVELLQPEFWVIENPKGRIRKVVPEIGKAKLIFQPCDYGDPYTKETFLYGEFNPNLKKNPVQPLLGSLIHKMPSTWKNERSLTPEGFAMAFFEANQ